MQFSEEVVLSGATFFLRVAGTGDSVPATVTTAGATATLDPTAALAPVQAYEVTVKGTVTDLAGLPLGADAVWTFTTVTPGLHRHHPRRLLGLDRVHVRGRHLRQRR